MKDSAIYKPMFEPIPNVKILINIGALMDIPTGSYLKGKYGESILNGGLGLITGIAGRGNMFKSTIMHYMMLSAADKMNRNYPVSMSTYDTEINIHESHLSEFVKPFKSFDPYNIFANQQWIVTDKTIYYGDEWFEILKNFLKEKIKNKDKLLVETPFLSRDGKTLLKMIPPTFSEIDSFSEFETSDVAKIQNENLLGEAGGNTVHMRQGLAKTRLLMELPNIAGSSNHFVLTTVQVGQAINMQSGPISLPPPKKLQHMRSGEKFNGVTDKFFFLTSNFWQAISANPLINQTTKTVEYPKNQDDNVQGDCDLNIVTLKQLRGKSGPSGSLIEIIVSQREGVLASLTEFHYIKSQDRYGISGTLQHYYLDLMPEVKLSRTTVRSKIDSNPALQRAINITAEMCQMKQYWRDLPEGILCTPAELYNDLKALGYDWNVLLATRGWWTVDNDKTDIPFLSTMDLLLMRKGEYKPYWMR
jgi:hypothetical protein